MKTNQNGHTLRNLTNRVIAVIDDPRQTQATVETLERAGVADRDLATFSGEEGARQIDAEGALQRRRQTHPSGTAALHAGRNASPEVPGGTWSGVIRSWTCTFTGTETSTPSPEFSAPRRALHQRLRSVDNRRCRSLTRRRHARADRRR